MKAFTLLFLCVPFLLGCNPAVDSPKVYDNATIKFSYPGNWDVSDAGSMIYVREKLILGMLDGETKLTLSIDDLVSPAPRYEHSRDVQTKIGKKIVKGQLTFDWLEGDFESSYFVEKGAHSVRVKVASKEEALKKAEPGIRQVLESLEIL